MGGWPKIIHTADLHLGMTFKNLGDRSKQHRRDCLDVFSNIIDLCIKEKADALLIAGDLFDKPNPSKTIVNHVIKGFEKLNEKNIPVLISTGNHDPYVNGSVWFGYNFPANVHIYDSKDLEPKTIGNLDIYGLAYTENGMEPLKNFKPQKSDNYKTGLIHGSTVNIQDDSDPENSYRPITKQQINKSGLDYIALGHFHDFLEMDSKVKCCYCGSPEGLSFKNNYTNCVLIVEFQNEGVKVKKHETAIRQFENQTIDCTKLEDDSQIRKTLQDNANQNKILRLTLKGNPGLDLSIDKDSLEKEFYDKYFFLKIKDNIHIPQDLNEDETIRGQFIRILREEVEKEEAESKRKKLENAMRIGIGYLDKNM